jgi:hypothetical protein
MERLCRRDGVCLAAVALPTLQVRQPRGGVQQPQTSEAFRMLRSLQLRLQPLQLRLQCRLLATAQRAAKPLT